MCIETPMHSLNENDLKEFQVVPSLLRLAILSLISTINLMISEFHKPSVSMANVAKVLVFVTRGHRRIVSHCSCIQCHRFFCGTEQGCTGPWHPMLSAYQVSMVLMWHRLVSFLWIVKGRQILASWYLSLPHCPPQDIIEQGMPNVPWANLPAH